MLSADEIVYYVLLSRIEDESIEYYIDMHSISELVRRAGERMEEEPPLLRIAGERVKVVGDIHGNIDDLIRIFEMCGYPQETVYVFLGDYVDRRQFGIEVLCLLAALKCRFPDRIFMLRGNHETPTIPKHFGFYSECVRKYTSSLFYEFTEMFRNMPVAAVVNNEVFCVHGGISPLAKSLRDIECTKKVEYLDDNELVEDMLWSDPKMIEKDFEVSPRGSGYFFGENALKKFLDDNSLKVLIRSHEMCMDGFNQPFENKSICYTVFSNSNYCNFGNKGAVITVSDGIDLDIHSFEQQNNDKEKRRILIPDWILISKKQGKISLNVEEQMDCSQPEVVFD